jgi:hypothetical protein
MMITFTVALTPMKDHTVAVNLLALLGLWKSRRATQAYVESQHCTIY